MLDPLKLDSQTIVSCHVGTGNGTLQEQEDLLAVEPSLQL